MTRPAAEIAQNRHQPGCSVEPDNWKKTVSETLRSLHIIPERFNGRVVVTFKEGGVSFLEKTETFK